jgi:hypothetical protein
VRRNFPFIKAWSPLEIKGGAGLWLDASQPGTLFQDSALTTPALSDADPVGGWKDKSGRGFDVIQATAGLRPLLKLNRLNGRPSILFDGVDDTLRKTTTTLGVSAPGLTVVCVYKAAGTPRGNMFGLVTSAGGVNRATIINDLTTSAQLTYGQRRLDADTSTLKETTGLLANTWRHVQVVWDVTNANLTGYINGSANTGGSWLTSGNFDSTNVNINISFISNWFAGEIAEIIVYEKALSSAERALIETYLRSKYAIY